MRTTRSVLTLGLILPLAALTMLAASFPLRALSRSRLEVVSATEHSSLSRESCVECHAPIAEEWRSSFHFRSVTGRLWGRIREKGYAQLFAALRVPCMNCHAPANVVDLTPGAQPLERSSAREWGVDCVSCHVSERGIVGPGRFVAAPHEVLRDERFRDPVLASTTLCASCHEEAGGQAKVVSDWQHTPFAEQEVTCLHCHMPQVGAPLVAGGPPRRRRSHAFPGDKRPEMLARALNATLTLSDGRRAVARIVNDRVGHAFPAAGMNSLRVTLRVYDEADALVDAVERGFGNVEWIPGYLDFWPFQVVTKIPFGETREISLPLPAGHGTAVAEFRYRDWFTLKDRDTHIQSISKRY